MARSSIAAGSPPFTARPPQPRTATSSRGRSLQDPPPGDRQFVRVAVQSPGRGQPHRRLFQRLQHFRDGRRVAEEEPITSTTPQTSTARPSAAQGLQDRLHGDRRHPRGIANRFLHDRRRSSPGDQRRHDERSGGEAHAAVQWQFPRVRGRRGYPGGQLAGHARLRDGRSSAVDGSAYSG